MGNVMM